MTITHHSTDPRWQGPHIVDRVIVELTKDYDDKLYKQILQNHKAHERKHLAAIDRHVVICDVAEIEALLDELEKAGLLVDAEPDGLIQAQSETVEERSSSFTPNDPNLSREWHLNDIKVPDAWGITQGGVVTLAMLDSGAYKHPDLAANMIAGYNFVSYSDNTNDTGALGGHGTATSGSAGAVINNGVGIAGIAKCRIMPLVVLASNNYCAWSDVADATNYAADHGARVINISCGGTSSSSTMSAAMTYAWRKNVVIFASAMNNNNSTINYPAGCANVMAVAATQQNGTKAGFSNYGTWVDIAAPGNGIFTLKGAAGYAGWNGTSFSSPICAGVAALMIAANPKITNTSICNIMKNTADQVAGHPWGKVNAYKAVVAARAA